MRSRAWVIPIIIIIGIIAAISVAESLNSIEVTVTTNGSDLNVKCYSLFYSLPPQMGEEMKQAALKQLIEPNSTTESVKNEIKSIAKNYNYTASVTIKSQFGTDQLPMQATVNGTSMLPTLINGQQIILVKTKDFKVNDIVVAVHPDYGLIVKRVQEISQDNVYLMSDNRNVDYVTTQEVVNGQVEDVTYKYTPLDTWLSKERIIGVVKIY